MLDWNHCPEGSLASKSPSPIFLEQAIPLPQYFSLSRVQTYKNLVLTEQVFLAVLATGGSQGFPQPCVGSLQLSQAARAHLHRVLPTAAELVVKSKKLSPREKQVSQCIREQFPSRTQSGDTTCSGLQTTPTDVQIPREGGAGRLPGAEPNPQVTGLG